MAKRTRNRPTKKLILGAALKLFNRDGYVNVRLQHIADEAFISVGNLAYHYPNKAAIFESLYARLTQEQRELLAEFKIVPLFDYIERLIQQTYQLQQHYVFFYLDTLELLRAFPEVADAHRLHIQWQEELLRSMIDFNVSRGAFVPEPWPDLYDKVAVQFRECSDCWLAQQLIRGNPATQAIFYSEALWSLLIPYFSKTGGLEYRQMRALLGSE